MNLSDKANKINSSVPITLFQSGWEKCKPSHSFGPTIRPYYLFHFILNGCGKYYVNNKIYSLKKGQGFLILPGDTTFYKADKKDPWEYCWIGFDGYEIDTILKHCGLDSGNLIFTDHSKGKLADSLMELVYIVENANANEYTILGQLYLSFGHMNNKENHSKNIYEESHLNKALNYIHNNYTSNIQVSDVADYVGIDRTYLYKVFKSTKNTSPSQYLIIYRLNIAKRLLVNTDYSVTEILYSCGFKDGPSFHKHFRKQLNMTPLEYRESNRI